LVAQSDIQDNILDLSTTHYDTVTTVCTLLQAVAGANTGIEHVYNLGVDAFTTSPFVQGQTYCFMAIAYGANLDRLHPVCGSSNQYVGSNRGSGGALLRYCVTADNSLATADEMLDGFRVNLYPNPATEVVQVSIDGASSADVTCFDLLGNVVYKQQISVAANIPLSGFSKGMYLIQVSAEGKLPVTKKLMVR
jgi:hypothetical protein